MKKNVQADESGTKAVDYNRVIRKYENTISISAEQFVLNLIKAHLSSEAIRRIR